MFIGIGGAGSKISSTFNNGTNVVVNISESELAKANARERILAVVHSERGQRQGAKKNPDIGKSAYTSISSQLGALIKGNIVVTSTGGGTGNGITWRVLEDIARSEGIPEEEKTTFILVLPFADKEPSEYVENTISFMVDPVSRAIDSGNTGNIFLVSNREKFVKRLTEQEYNAQIVSRFKEFLNVPEKCTRHDSLEGHIDGEDFQLYLSKPYFNYFTVLDYDAQTPLADQMTQNSNPMLLAPANPIEALFLLEVPKKEQTRFFYTILEYFESQHVVPIFAVVHNPALEKPRLTVSQLYSRKPSELVDDFVRISQTRTKSKIQKSIEQHVTLNSKPVDREREAIKAAAAVGKKESDVVSVLKRIGKL